MLKSFDLCLRQLGLVFSGTALIASFFAFALALPTEGTAQSTANLCVQRGGTVGTNLFDLNGSFGTGSTTTAGQTGPALPAGRTDYTFTTYGGNSPPDGQYSIVNRLNTTTFNYWFNPVSDHTTGTISGQMMVINAAFAPGVFLSSNIYCDAEHQLSVFRTFSEPSEPAL